ncbi:N-acetyltransferase ESCO2-like isoform X1 [Penaeus chinensis]|uniref:N-acetyltransferase ESCO2-like isoform X1 n=1 Tax=Penaeus chinensis TaxID=139456 RepID=UPI001FB7AC97|nr:N-acetyltransferase ESCO2-like isoform X1 [Penaeus chinensis]
MTPMVPDCGVLTTPRRSPPIKLMDVEEPIKKSPVSASFAAVSPPRSAEATGVTLSNGFSFSFYKSPKSVTTPYRRIEPLPVQSPRVHKSRRDGINKGVGHKIKKPKLKAKGKEQKKRDVKIVAKRLKEGKFTPRLPSDRSPVKTPTPLEKKKRHVLSSPGMSFLEDEDAGFNLMEPSSSKKFFTSRSRAAATVQLGKNIKLSAKNGDITLKQRVGTFEKKNVGRIVEDELNQFIGQSEMQSLDQVALLPSVQSTSRPVPTRVPSTPSPKKRISPRKRARTPSPRKRTEKNSLQTDLNVSTNSELQDMELILQEWDDNQENPGQEQVVTRRSPRKNTVGDKENKVDSPRRSPRKATDGFPKNTMNDSPRRSPRKPIPGSIPQRSPSRALKRSPSKSSPQKGKFFSIFDPKRRLSDKVSVADKIMNNRTVGKKVPLRKSDGSQMMIDAGQKEFGAKQCNVCGIIYEIGNPEDEASHEAHHNSFLNTLKYIGWKKERLVRDLDHHGGRVIMVLPTDSQHCWRKVEEIREIVDQELGFAENGIRVKENTKVFFYVLEKRIVGCLIAETIREAHKVIPQRSPIRGGGQLVCCSEKRYKVWAGISRIWVLASERGKGIASTLVDAMRGNFLTSHFLTLDEFAFSDPTESGMGFAEKYTQRRDFLVYRRL